MAHALTPTLTLTPPLILNPTLTLTRTLTLPLTLTLTRARTLSLTLTLTLRDQTVWAEANEAAAAAVAALHA